MLPTSGGTVHGNLGPSWNRVARHDNGDGGELVAFPASPETAARESHAGGASPGLVLVAHHSAQLRRRLGRAVDRAGFSCVATSNAAELLQQLSLALDSGIDVQRVYLDEELVNGATARRALVEAVKSVVGGGRVVSVAARAANGETPQAAAVVAPRPEKIAADPSWVDVQAAVRRFEGDDELWRTLLGQFLLRYRDLCERLERELSDRPQSELAALTARVGGVASRLGMVRLGEALHELCDALSDAGPALPGAEIELLRRAHEATIRVVDELLSEESMRRARELALAFPGRPLAAA